MAAWLLPWLAWLSPVAAITIQEVRSTSNMSSSSGLGCDRPKGWCKTASMSPSSVGTAVPSIGISKSL
eukprot:Skav216579  [mRNA]  locus=scaffold3598:184130:185093:+ [translate_table: standard]